MCLLFVYVFVCVAVGWCGGAPLSFSLDRRGDGQTAEQRARRWGQPATADMLKDWKKLSQVRMEATYCDILVHPNLSCTLNHYAS